MKGSLRRFDEKLWRDRLDALLSATKKEFYPDAIIGFCRAVWDAALNANADNDQAGTH